MKAETWMFASCSIFFVLVTPLFYWSSSDITGTTALVMTFLLTTLVAFYLGFHPARWSAPRGPQGRRDRGGRRRAGLLPALQLVAAWCAHVPVGDDARCGLHQWWPADHRRRPGRPSRCADWSSSTTGASTPTEAPRPRDATVTRGTPVGFRALRVCVVSLRRLSSTPILESHAQPSGRSPSLARRAELSVLLAVSGCSALSNADEPAAADGATDRASTRPSRRRSCAATSVPGPPRSTSTAGPHPGDARHLRGPRRHTAQGDPLQGALNARPDALDLLGSAAPGHPLPRARQCGRRRRVVEAAYQARFATRALTLDEQTYPSFVSDGATVGVGMPAIVRFDIPPSPTRPRSIST